MDEKTLLEGLMTKQKRGEGKVDSKNAVNALMTLRKTIDEKQLATYLIKLHFSVCQKFMVEFCKEASDKEIENLVNALLDDEIMKTKNPTLFLYPKGFAALYSLTSAKKYAPAYKLLNSILAKAEGQNGFSEGCFTVLAKIFTLPKDAEILVSLYNQLDGKKLVSEKSDKDRISRFLKDAHFSHHEKAKTKEILSDLPKEDASIRFVEQVNEIGFNKLSNIEQTQADIIEMLKMLIADSESSKNQELINLKNEIARTLKLDYADFEKSKDNGHSKALFKVYRSMLAKIFKQLKRLDIPLV